MCRELRFKASSVRPKDYEISQGGHAEWGGGFPLGTIDSQLPCAHFTDRETEVQGREVAGGGERRHHGIALGQDHVSLSAPSWGGCSG